MSRGLALLGICLAAAAWAFATAQIGGLAYANVAERGGASAVPAARISSALMPWAADASARHGWVLAQSGNAAEMSRRYAQALRWAPANPTLWTEYSQARCRAGLFDAETEHAVARAQELGGPAPPIRRALAEQGLSYWHRGSSTLRQRWLLSMQAELEADPRPFLRHVLSGGRFNTFCAGPASRLQREPWCERMRAAAMAPCGADRRPCGSVAR